MTWRSIQCLRALAAIGVLLYHFGKVEIGAAGVDLFFVISGFIMASVVPGKEPGRFLADRAWRILPPYYAAVALELVLIQPALDWHRLALTATLWPVGLPYLNQSWTLSYEFLFYIACAAFLLFGRVTLIAVPLALACEALLNDPYSSFIGNPLILEFLGGVMLARLPRRHGPAALLAAPLALAIFWPSGFDRALSFGIPALLLVHGALSYEHRFNSHGFNFLMLLGDASYSIYLTHMTVGRLLPDDVSWVAAVSVALLGGLLFHRVVERPLLKHLGELRRRMRNSEVATPLAVPAK
jgi:exopolysaccharide production protein ExoZ